MSDHLDLRDVHGRHEPDPTFRLELRRQVEAIVRSPAAATTASAGSIGSNEEDLIMLTGTRSQPPQVSKRAPRWLLPAAAAVVVVAAAAAVAVVADDDGQTTIAGPRESRTIVEGTGTFPADSEALAGYIVELSAIESDGAVSGFAEFRITGTPTLRIALACTTVRGAEVIVGGEVSESDSAERPVGTWAAVIVRDSPAFEDPTEVGLWFEDPAQHGSCAEFVAAIPGDATGPETLFPAFGDIEVGTRDDERAPGSARTVFEDGFDDDSGGWLTTQGFGMTVETGGGQQRWTLTSPGTSDVQRPLSLRELVLDMEVTLDVISVTPGDTVAVLCRKGLSAPEDQFYAFRLGAAGASIAVTGKEDLAQTLATDTSVAVPSGPFELTARCIDVNGVAELEMSVDDDVVLTATDTNPLAAGVGGIRVEAGPDSSRDGEVVLDRIVVREVG